MSQPEFAATALEALSKPAEIVPSYVFNAESRQKSAELLDKIIDVTDALPGSTSLLTVTNSLLKRRR